MRTAQRGIFDDRDRRVGFPEHPILVGRAPAGSSALAASSGLGAWRDRRDDPRKRSAQSPRQTRSPASGPSCYQMLMLIASMERRNGRRPRLRDCLPPCRAPASTRRPSRASAARSSGSAMSPSRLSSAWPPRRPRAAPEPPSVRGAASGSGPWTRASRVDRGAAEKQVDALDHQRRAVLQFEGDARRDAQLQRAVAAERLGPARGGELGPDDRRPFRLEPAEDPAAAAGDDRRGQPRGWRCRQRATRAGARLAGAPVTLAVRVIRAFASHAVDPIPILATVAPAGPVRAARLVRPPSPRSAVARAAGPAPGPLPGVAQRDHAAANHGGDGRPLF